MSKHTSPFILAADCPPTQFNLPLPPGLEDNLTPAQAAKVTKVQVQFAHGVGQLVTKSYAEIAAILDEPVSAVRPQAK
jgi:hypothetical protein